jgi:hypothetical protein
MGASLAGSPIEAKPNRCGKEGRKVLAHCHISNIKKEFYLHNIKRIEDYDWSDSISLHFADKRYFTNTLFSITDDIQVLHFIIRQAKSGDR